MRTTDKQLIFIFLLFICLLARPIRAHAEDWDLSVSPPLTRVKLPAAKPQAIPLTLENKTTDPVTLQVVFSAFTAAGDTGQVRPLTAEEATKQGYDSLLAHTQLLDGDVPSRELTLAPKQKKTVQIVTGEAASSTHDYSFSVIFRKKPDTSSLTSSGSEVLPAIAANILVSLSTSRPAQARVDTFSAPTLLQKGPVPFQIRVENDDRHLIKPQGFIEISNMFGQVVGHIELTPTYILPKSNRILASSGTKDIKSSEKGAIDTSDPLTTFWKESFLLGPYKASLKLRIAENGPLITQVIYFFAFPLQFVFGTILASLILLVLILRVKRRLG